MMNNMRSGNFTKDMQFALPTILKGKSPVPPAPHKIKGAKEVKKIFEKTRREGK